MKCSYDKVQAGDITQIPQGSCVRFFCRGTGEVREGTFCSYFYDADLININVQDADNIKKIAAGRGVFVKKKKGAMSREATDLELVKEELADIRREHADMLEKLAFMTKAIKLLSNRSNPR